MFLLIYIDNVILIGSNPKVLHQLIHCFHKEFSLKDLSPLQYFVGMDIHKLTVSGLFHNQRKHIDNLFKKDNMVHCKSSHSLLCSTTLFFQEGALLSYCSPYRNIVGSVQYVTLIRPNLAYSVMKYVNLCLHL